MTDKSALTFQSLETDNVHALSDCSRREPFMPMVFNVDKMSCSGCARRVSEGIRAAAPNAQVTVDLESRTVEVASDALDARSIAALITDLGYPATPIRPSSTSGE